MKDDILQLMRSRLRTAIDAYSESREHELRDLQFAAGNPDNRFQWPADVINARSNVQGQTINARPTLTINKLPQHIHQITNDQRQNRPSGKVIPVDGDADKEVADILDGMVRHIEYISDADVAYDTACFNQVTYGEGYIRLLTEYVEGTFDQQEIKIGRIRNSFSVYMDPTTQDPCGADAKWCVILQSMTKEEYESQFPDAKTYSGIQEMGVGNQDLMDWFGSDSVKIAEYFYIEQEDNILHQYPGGTTAIKGSHRAKIHEAAGLQPNNKRNVKLNKVKWCKTNGFEILSDGEWAGKWIPIIKVIGNEFEIEGRIHLSGIVRNAKDAQRLYNYWVSQEAEMLALAPKAPFIGYGGQFEGYEHQWKTANINNWPYLEVNPEVTDGQGGILPLPQRAAPPLPQAGLIQAKMGASDDIKATTGQYDSSLGAEANEKSGKAIIARERQTDTGTYHYVDNLARAVRYTARQIVDLIPKIYDTQRIARIVGLDGEIDHAHIDPGQQEAVKHIKDQETGQTIKKIYNPSIGQYDVCITTGPSYMTKRQAALDAMSQLLQGNPQLWQVAGDLFIKNMDWPGAEEIAERFQKTIDPKLLSDEEDPALAAAQQQIQQMDKEMQQMHSMLVNVQNSFEAQKAHLEAKKADHEEFRGDIEAYNAETQRLAVIAKAASPEEIQKVVMQTIQQMLAQPALDQEVPNQQTQQQPIEGQ